MLPLGKLKWLLQPTGLSIEEIDRSTCLLTYEGLLRTNPCKDAGNLVARMWMRGEFPIEVTESALEKFSAFYTAAWLIGYSSNAYGADWPWRHLITESGDLCSIRNSISGDCKSMVRLIKAYIMWKSRVP